MWQRPARGMGPVRAGGDCHAARPRGRAPPLGTGGEGLELHIGSSCDGGHEKEPGSIRDDEGGDDACQSRDRLTPRGPTSSLQHPTPHEAGACVPKQHRPEPSGTEQDRHRPAEPARCQHRRRRRSAEAPTTVAMWMMASTIPCAIGLRAPGLGEAARDWPRVARFLSDLSSWKRSKINSSPRLRASATASS